MLKFTVRLRIFSLFTMSAQILGIFFSPTILIYSWNLLVWLVKASNFMYSFNKDKSLNGIV